MTMSKRKKGENGAVVSEADRTRQEALREDIERHARMENYNAARQKQRDENAILVQAKLLNAALQSTTFIVYMSLVHPTSTVSVKVLKMWRALSPVNMSVLLAIREHRNNIVEMY